MKASQRRLLFLLAAVTLTGVVRADDSAWTTLFDGQTLTGWRQVIERSVNPKLPDSLRGKVSFRVEQGTIIGKAENCSMHSYLCTEKEYGNFELTGEIFIGWPEPRRGEVNSGIQIRSRWHDDAPSGEMTGLQVDLANRPGCGLLYFEGHKSAPVFAQGRALQSRFREKLKETANQPNLFRKYEWNSFRILADGPHIQTFINGTLVEDYTNAALYTAQPRGVIGLQVHEILNAKPAEVRWRNLRLREVLD
jgi:hypothetical protein